MLEIKWILWFWAMVSTVRAREQNVDDRLPKELATEDLGKELHRIKSDVSRKLDELIKMMECSSRNYAFFAQRELYYDRPDTFIPYTRARLNPVVDPLDGGNGKTPVLDLDTGLFTAPVDGTYHFTFSSLKVKREEGNKPSLAVRMRKILDPNYDPSNAWITGQSEEIWKDSIKFLAEGRIHSTQWYDYYPFHVQAAAQLKRGQRVGVQLIAGRLHGLTDLNPMEPDHTVTSFGGFLIQRSASSQCIPAHHRTIHDDNSQS